MKLLSKWQANAGGGNGSGPSRIRFGEYEIEPAAGELRKNGNPVRIQEQPFLVLVALLNRAGEVVTREELRERLWPGDTFGDFDQGLNTAINKVREALGDSPVNPQFIETLPKRGYRFTYPLEPKSVALPIAAAGRRSQLAKLLVACAAIMATGTAILALFRDGGKPQESRIPLRRFSIPISTLTAVPPDARLVAISPNGRHIAFVDGDDKSRLWIQDLDQQRPRVIEGSDGAISPFWSPDSSTVGFTRMGAVKKVSVTGGPVTTVCDMPGVYISGGAWSRDGGSIAFTSGPEKSVYIAPAAGGVASLLVSPQMLEYRTETEAGDHAMTAACIGQPHFLSAPGGTVAVLFTRFTDKATLMLLDLKTRRLREIGSGRDAFYSSTGHLLYQSENDLWCRRFSAEQLEFAGEAFRVARNAADATVASDGTLVYRDEASQQLMWLDRTGARIGTAGPSFNRIYYPALSPDGLRVAAETWEEQSLDVWITDLARATRIRLTSHPATDILPVWAPDGESVAFSSYRAGNIDILLRRADAGSKVTTLAAMPENERVSDWSRDGQYILYSLQHPKNGYDLWYLKRNAGGKWESHPFLQTSFDETSPKLSPDGRYVAYLSDESGRKELYVRPFPSGGRKWPISSGGAAQIRWSRKSGEIFYIEARKLVAVSVKTTPDFQIRATTRLFSHAGFGESFDPNYDVSADGQKIILPEKVGAEEPVIRVVQNWLAEFREQR